MKGLLVISLIVLGSFVSLGQAEIQILDAQTRKPIPYAKLYNKNARTGIVSNFEGKLERPDFSENDTIKIFALTYSSQWLIWKNVGHTISLQPKIQQLQEVDVMAENAALYSLLNKCISLNKKYLTTEISKAFLDVESFRNGKQVELFQAYYNADLKGYDVSDLKIKSGRYYFSPDSNFLFTSTNLSRAFCMNGIFEENDFFPNTPFTLNKRQLRKTYRLSSGGKYLGENGETIIKINFTPREKSRNQFKGSITIDSNSLSLHQLNYDVENASVYPFERVMRKPTSQVDMNIQKFFKSTPEETSLESIQYTTRLVFENDNRKADTILSKSLLSLFDRNDAYSLPYFQFLKEDYHGDLRNSLLLQHTAPYWACYSSFEKLASQKDFIENCQVLLDQNGNYSFSKRENGEKIKSRRLLESPYQLWSPYYRVRIRERQKQTKDYISAAASTIPATQYELSCQILLDFNYDCEQILHWTTKAVFDPFQSYFNFELTPQALSFINIYFDLVEIQRLILEEQIALSDQQTTTIVALHSEALKKLELFKKEYCNKVERGNNLEELKKYNEVVKAKFGIDNLEHFGVKIAD
ncbi:MAG: hypothetical protein N4A41_00370 [Crocinitomicaceae bacterium]|jgi:hypothetical protein|nr:hypothetical protein [Crocinitomicaceae bacterium]